MILLAIAAVIAPILPPILPVVAPILPVVTPVGSPVLAIVAPVAAVRGSERGGGHDEAEGEGERTT